MAAAFGGLSKHQQFKDLKAGCEVGLGLPGLAGGIGEAERGCAGCAVESCGTGLDGSSSRLANCNAAWCRWQCAPLGA